MIDVWVGRNRLGARVRARASSRSISDRDEVRSARGLTDEARRQSKSAARARATEIRSDRCARRQSHHSIIVWSFALIVCRSGWSRQRRTLSCRLLVPLTSADQQRQVGQQGRRDKGDKTAAASVDYRSTVSFARSRPKTLARRSM